MTKFFFARARCDSIRIRTSSRGQEWLEKLWNSPFVESDGQGNHIPNGAARNP